MWRIRWWVKWFEAASINTCLFQLIVVVISWQLFLEMTITLSNLSGGVTDLIGYLICTQKNYCLSFSFNGSYPDIFSKDIRPTRLL